MCWAFSNYRFQIGILPRSRPCSVCVCLCTLRQRNILSQPAISAECRHKQTTERHMSISLNELRAHQYQMCALSLPLSALNGVCSCSVNAFEYEFCIEYLMSIYDHTQLAKTTWFSPDPQLPQLVEWQRVLHVDSVCCWLKWYRRTDFTLRQLTSRSQRVQAMTWVLRICDEKCRVHAYCRCCFCCWRMKSFAFK